LATGEDVIAPHTTFAGDERSSRLQLVAAVGGLSLSELRRRASDSFGTDRASAESIVGGRSGGEPGVD
jgi:hypothetical protein